MFGGGSALCGKNRESSQKNTENYTFKSSHDACYRETLN